MVKGDESVWERFRSLALVEVDPRELLPAGGDAHAAVYLLEAADVVNEIFWRQALPQESRATLLAQVGGNEELKELLLFNYGPYDRLNNNAPLLPVEPKPAGAGFYPPTLTQTEFSEYIQTHPEYRAEFESPYTVIRRENSHLEAVPYHLVYREQVARLSALLEKAGTAATDPVFRRYLHQRAKDLAKDDYYESDSLWVSLRRNPLDVVIGPYEVYEDKLMGLKAAYEAMLLRRDFEGTKKILHFRDGLPSLCRAVGQELGKSLEMDDGRLDLSVADLIYSGGDARKAIPAIAFTLPNDERVIEEVGSRQVILKNVLEAKFHHVAWKIHTRLLPQAAGDRRQSFEKFFNHTLYHEISHTIGPQLITKNGEQTTVNRCLKQYYSVLEEAKADTLAACFMLRGGGDAGEQTFLETYVPGIMRPIRYGLTSAHGGANAIQFNFLLREGALSVSASGEISFDCARVSRALMSLTSEIIDVQERGDFETARKLVSDYCVMSPEIERVMSKLSDVAVDIRIRYKIG